MVSNGFEGVPWMIGGGAQHSADVGRLLAYAALNGAEGVIAPGDLKVVATAGTADGQIHVARGAVSVLNRSTNAYSQSYTGRATQVSDLTPASTGASGRSDLVVVRVKDPQFPPYQGMYSADASIKNGPYIFPEIISGVPANTTDAFALAGEAGRSVYAIARLDIPPNTTKFTDSMIKDLRDLAMPRSLSRAYGGQPTKSQDYHVGSVDSGDPYSMAGFSDVQPMIDIPKWATHVDVSVIATSIFSASFTPPNTNLMYNNGACLVKLGSLFGPHINYDLPDQPSGESNMFTLQAANINAPVPVELRGTRQQASLRVRIDSGQIIAQPWSMVLFQVSFYERVA